MDNEWNKELWEEKTFLKPELIINTTPEKELWEKKTFLQTELIINKTPKRNLSVSLKETLKTGNQQKKKAVNFCLLKLFILVFFPLPFAFVLWIG